MTGTSSKSRSVNFDLAKTCVHVVQTAEDVEIEDTYYVREDYHRIEDENDVTVKAMEDPKQRRQELQLEQEQELCFRGLEQKTAMGSKKRSNNKSRSTKAVLKAQKELRKQKELDESSSTSTFEDIEFLARVYNGYSNVCQLRANQTAKKDAMIAKQIYHQSSSSLIVDFGPVLPELNNKNKRRSSSSQSSSVCTADTDESSSTDLESVSTFGLYPTNISTRKLTVIV